MSGAKWLAKRRMATAPKVCRHESVRGHSDYSPHLRGFEVSAACLVCGEVSRAMLGIRTTQWPEGPEDIKRQAYEKMPEWAARAALRALDILAR